ncbi:CopG family transcriptional regulator [Arcobacter sp. FW59]|nr:CopG family transcriptional regulator [Arcobacter sp. FW59]
MAQVTIYMDNQLEQKIKELSNNSGISISKFISTILEQNINSKWTNDIRSLAGSWSDFPSIDDIRTNGKDIEREEF